MTDVPRRTVQELLFLYEHERSVKDIIVEGDYDAAVVQWFLRDLGKETVAVRRIESIEIDEGELRFDGRDGGNRERVVFFAEQISLNLKVEGRVLCIADRDYGNWIGGIPEIRYLVFTDYSCMELYVWNSAVLDKFLAVYCNRPDWSAEQFMEALRGPLQAMFAIRLAARSLDMRLSWIDRVICLEVEAWSLHFDVQEFVTRLLNKNSAFVRQQQLLECVEHYRSMFTEDPRDCIHSHDFSRLVEFLLRRKGVASVAINSSTVSRAMASCLTVSSLLNERLFRRIREFACTSVCIETVIT